MVEDLTLFQACKQVFLKQFLKRKFDVHFPPISIRTRFYCLTLLEFQVLDFAQFVINASISIRDRHFSPRKRIFSSYTFLSVLLSVQPQNRSDISNFSVVRDSIVTYFTSRQSVSEKAMFWWWKSSFCVSYRSSRRVKMRFRIQIYPDFCALKTGEVIN